jgi:hypothetical protein
MAHCKQHLHCPYVNEPFNNLNEKEYNNALKYITNSDDIVVKNHIRHFYNYTDKCINENILNDFLSIDWFTMVLIRRNLFNQTLSYCRARLTEEWNSYSEKSVHIDPEWFLRVSTKLWWSIEQLYVYSQKINYNKIVFTEDLTNDVQTDASMFLSNIDTNLLKNISEKSPPKNKIIENYNELRDIAVNTNHLNPIPGVVIDDNWHINSIKWNQ